MDHDSLKVLGILEKLRVFFANGVQLVDLCHTAVLSVAMAREACKPDPEPSPPPAPAAAGEPLPSGKVH